MFGFSCFYHGVTRAFAVCAFFLKKNRKVNPHWLATFAQFVAQFAIDFLLPCFIVAFFVVSWEELTTTQRLLSKVKGSEEFLKERLSTVTKLCTHLKINMEPKHGGLEDDFPFQTGANKSGNWSLLALNTYITGRFVHPHTHYKRPIESRELHMDT